MEKYDYKKFLKLPEIAELKDRYWRIVGYFEGTMIMETLHDDMRVEFWFAICGESQQETAGVDILNDMDTEWLIRMVSRPEMMRYYDLSETKVVKTFEYIDKYDYKEE